MALIALATPFVVAAQTSREYAPKLADIMSTVQFRHLKLSIAGQQQNWELAAYELGLLKSGLVDAVALYTNIPVENITMVDGPVKAIDGAIASKSSAAFGKAFQELTAGCNSCHQSIGRDFIAIKVPTASPFSNQSFSPAKAQGKADMRR
ncbi:MAG: hypothetical protein K2X57_23985 [Xanthobacteraceae bacterium]|nr:hypothetical protein [Xanthobacteraceae bacterium]